MSSPAASMTSFSQVPENEPFTSTFPDRLSVEHVLHWRGVRHVHAVRLPGDGQFAVDDQLSREGGEVNLAVGDHRRDELGEHPNAVVAERVVVAVPELFEDHMIATDLEDRGVVGAEHAGDGRVVGVRGRVRGPDDPGARLRPVSRDRDEPSRHQHHPFGESELGDREGFRAELPRWRIPGVSPEMVLLTPDVSGRRHDPNTVRDARSPSRYARSTGPEDRGAVDVIVAEPLLLQHLIIGLRDLLARGPFWLRPMAKILAIQDIEPPVLPTPDHQVERLVVLILGLEEHRSGAEVEVVVIQRRRGRPLDLLRSGRRVPEGVKKSSTVRDDCSGTFGSLVNFSFTMLHPMPGGSTFN